MISSERLQHTIAFTAADAIPSDGKIKIDFPSASDFNLSGVNLGTITGLDGNFALTNTSAESLTIIRSVGNSSAPGVTVSIPLNNVVNGNAGSSYTANVTTLDSSNNKIDSGTSASFTINKADTTTAVTTSGSPSTYGSPVTFTATVSVTSPGTGTPTGTVTFMDGVTTLGTGTLNGQTTDQATYTTTATQLAAGSHTNIKAVYGGDSNYNGSTSSDITQTVNPKTLTVSGITASDKVYDGGTTATIDTSGASLSGIVGTDAVSLDASGATAAFASQDVANGITVTISGLSLSGAQASDYALGTPQATTTANITPKALTLGGITASNKVYDGTTAANLNTAGVTFTGLCGGDTVTLSGMGVGTFSDKNAGTGKTVTISGYTLGGGDAGNYYIAQPNPPPTAAISPKALTTMSGLSVPASKVYDGTTAATVSGSPGSLQKAEAPGAGTTSDGIPYTGDTVSITGTATGTYNSKDVANATTVTYGGLSLTGTQAGDYTLTIQSAPATITALPLTLTGSRPYDGTTNADYAILSITNTVGSDDVNLASGSATLASASAGIENISSIGTLVLGGADAANYTLTGASGSVTVSKASTTTALITSNGNTQYGQSVTFTATVAATASGIGTPNGSVTFMDGTNTMGSGALDTSGQATYNTSNLITGGHSITAVYSGDDNFSGSTSPVVLQTVYSIIGTSTVNSAPITSVTSNNGTLNLTNVVNSAGIFEVPASVTSADNNAKVTIDATIVGQTSTGAPLTQITIAPVSNPPAPPTDASAVALNYDLGPSGAKFSSPITITPTYDPSKVPAGATPYIAWYNTQTGQWEQLTTVSINPNANPPTISATVNHFTTFTVFAAAQASPTPTPSASPTPTSSPTPTPSVTSAASPTPTVAPTSSAPTAPVVPPSTTPAQPTSTSNWGLIIGVIVVCLVIIFVVVFVLTRRKKPTSGSIGQ